MKKLLIGLLALGSISAFANNESDYYSNLLDSARECKSSKIERLYTKFLKRWSDNINQDHFCEVIIYGIEQDELPSFEADSGTHDIGEAFTLFLNRSRTSRVLFYVEENRMTDKVFSYFNN